MKRIVLLLVAVALFAACFTGCSTVKNIFGSLLGNSSTAAEDPAQVKALIAEAAACCRNADLDGILDCVTSSVATPVRALKKAANTLGGQNDEELMQTLLTLMGSEKLDDALAVCATLQASVTDVTFSDGKANAAVYFTYTAQGQAYEGTTNVTCQWEDGGWHIAGLRK